MSGLRSWWQSEDGTGRGFGELGQRIVFVEVGLELVVTGQPGVDDFGINNENDLVMSQAAVDMLKQTRPQDAEIVPIGRG